MAISRNIRAGTRTASLDYDARKENLLAQLRGQYDAVVSVEPKVKYAGPSKDLDKIFDSQATLLARKGVNDLTELGQGVDDKGKKTLINKNTGEELYKIVRDPDIKVDKWAEKGKDVKGIAAFSVNFDDQGRGVFLPVYEKSKAFGGPLADLVVPAAALAGAYFLGPAFAGTLGTSGGAAAGAALGSAGGQLAAEGRIDPLQTILAAGTAYLGSELLGGGAPEADLTGTTVGGNLGADAGLLGADAAFIAADAAQLAGQGLSEAAIAQNLAAAGVDTANATLAANLAVSGAGAETIANTLASFAPAGATNLFSGTAADLAAAGITTGGTGVAMSAADIAAGSTAAGSTAAGSTAAGAGTSMLGDNAGEIVDAITGAVAGTDIVDDILGILSSGASTAIDFEALRKVRDRALGLGKDAEATAIAAGEAANVPFTPYTVRTGAGTTEFGTDATGRPTATVTASPEYDALRGRALDLAGTTLGAIDPANAARSLFERSEALAGPARERETSALLSSLGAKGLLGFGQNLPTVGGTVAGVNPFVESLLSAQRTAQATAALEAEKFGTTEAQRQAALANTLIGTGQGIDTEAARTLGLGQSLGQTALSADQVSARNLLDATLKGQGLRLPYDQQALLAEIDAILGVRDFAKSGASRAIESDAVRNIIKEIFGT